MHDTRRMPPQAASPVEAHASPESRETRPIDRGLMVVHLLLDVKRAVEGLPDSRIRRTLRRKVESLQFVVDWWDAMPPRPEQVSAMLEVLLGLQEESNHRAASVSA
jgi:hypothetical protein